MTTPAARAALHRLAPLTHIGLPATLRVLRLAAHALALLQIASLLPGTAGLWLSHAPLLVAASAYLEWLVARGAGRLRTRSA